MQKKKICGGICIGLFAILLIFSTVFLDGIVDSFILDGVILAPENIQLWAQNPGQSKTVTVRNFTFYNLTNPRQFVYRHQKPVFREIQNYVFQERSNMTNIVYSEDKSFIKFDYWLFFTKIQGSRDPNEKVNILNLAPLGFWSQLDKVNISTFALQGFGGLFIEMNNTIKMQAIGQGVQGLFLSNYSSLSFICKHLQMQDVLCQNIFSDPNYGLGDPNNYEIWVDWSYYNSSGSYQVLSSYFGLSRYEMQVLDQHFQKWCLTIDSILNNWYCGGQICKSYDLTILQLSKAGITNNPPIGQGVESICFTGNISCQGFPQLYSFYKYKFPQINNSSVFKNLVFSKYTLSKLFTPYTGTFLNIGNLENLFQIGKRYDQGHSVDDLYLLQKITFAESLYHSIVIWQYAKYFTNQFILKKSLNGVRKHAGIAGVFSQALYQSFTQFSQWITKEYLSVLVAEKMPNCTHFLATTIDNITSAQLNNLCINVSQENYMSYYQLIEPCESQSKIQSFLKDYEISQSTFAQLCDKSKPSVYQLIQMAHQKIFTQYQCQMNIQSKKCTSFELGLKQFLSSQITKRPIKNSIKTYQQTFSGKDWNMQLQQWQYSHFLNQIYGSPDYDPDITTNSTCLRDLLSFDKLFNVPMVQNIYLVNQTTFQTLYYMKNRTLFQQYIKFVTIEVGFGGFTMKRSVQQLLFGFQDPFLKNFVDMDPMQGGDPSINPVVALNQLNITLQQAVNYPQQMYTGYSDPYLTRIYKSYAGAQIIAYNYTYYDGYEIKNQMKNPYKQAVKLSGTDAVQNKPMSTQSDYQYIFVNNLFRVGQLWFSQDVQKYGFDLFRYTLSPNFMKPASQYPLNDKFYQYQRGMLNLSFLGPPLVATKNHFLGVDQKWIDKVQIFDQSGENKQVASIYDQTQLILQPKTGATFTASIYLQTNLQLANDVLFDNGDKIFLPVFTIYRSANITQQTANDLLGVLKIAKVLPRRLMIGSLIGILFVILGLFLCRTKQRLVSPQSLLQSQNSDREQAFQAENNNNQQRIQ